MLVVSLTARRGDEWKVLRSKTKQRMASFVISRASSRVSPCVVSQFAKVARTIRKPEVAKRLRAGCGGAVEAVLADVKSRVDGLRARR